MINTKDAGNVNSVGLQSTLPRLRPFEIATLLLPGTNVQVMDATDSQFQTLVQASGMSVDDNGIAEWSFDDRCRVINHARKYGIDLFDLPNKNSSESEQKQFANNSESELFPELFEGHHAAVQAISDAIGTPTVPELRDDIDKLIEEMENSSANEQKEFGADE